MSSTLFDAGDRIRFQRDEELTEQRDRQPFHGTGDTGWSEATGESPEPNILETLLTVFRSMQ